MMIGVRDLVIDELRAVAAVPNGLDRNVLVRIQDSIAADVIYLYREQLEQMMRRQEVAGLPAAIAKQERQDFFAERLNLEYRNRAANGQGFSLPLYVESAKNFYHLEIRRHLQQVQDYLVHGRAVNELNAGAESIRELRARDPSLNALAHKVAGGLNAINETLERLSRVQTGAAAQVSRELRREMRDGLVELQEDQFANSLLSEAQMLAGAQRMSNELEEGGNSLKVR
ncbi:TPA: hypothetical protein L5F83_002117 [Pseudomonas aeruginosa]|nr:hypothetical protein [Pseudomonas aeruginosa]HBO9523771.1 hypothetical protein [Pseudomonas aeruginosa]HBO9529904.1 hypothetical protein [Pseudomonas aeruginosa]HBO9536312.1 hypothetical protein [Pseudomonas aeruginosa]HBO9547581.1 hypothetical protein [Pseudomonas aeruginosa]